MSQSEPILKIRDLNKSFGEFHLQNINLDLYSGEVHVLVGENGAGKSTLMKIIGGWFPHDMGIIEYRGTLYNFNSINEAWKGGITYVHQDLQNFENLTVAENIYFNNLPGVGKFNSILNWGKVHSDCRSVLMDLGILIDARDSLGTLGFAEKQLISAVRAYVAESKVVIFDEPTSAMGESEREILFEIVRRMKNRGTAIFYISHRLDEIQKIGDRVSVLDKGTIIKTSSCSEIDSQGILEMMIGEVHKERYPRLTAQKGKVVLTVENLALPPILKNVSFTIRKGEIIGITGLMGSGRTLLAKCLFGINQPDSGTILINGKERYFSHPLDAMNAGISLIPEDRMENGIFPIHSLKKNMTSAALKRFRHRIALDIRFMNQLTLKYADELSIKPGRSHGIVKNYSGGNLQKILIGRWLMKRSPIYIMDEPTRGIDAASKVDIYNTMNDIVEKGGSILLISSEIEEILGMCDRVLVLSGGKIRGEMKREVATKAKILEYATNEAET